MNKSPLKFITLALITGALFFTACGKKSEDAEEAAASEAIEIPEAPDAAIKYVFDGVAQADGAVLWQAMPASYQKDVNSIAQLAGTKLDAEIYDKTFAMVDRIASVLNKQKEFVFNSKLGGESKNEEELAQMREAWPSVMDLVDTITSSSLSTAAGLESFEGEAFFKGTVSALLSNFDALAKLQPEGEQMFLSDLGDTDIKVMESADRSASLEITVPGEEPEVKSVVKVEGRWIPLEMAEAWEAQTAEARTKLEAIDPEKMAKQKPQILGVFAMIEGILTQIEAAETQEQFDQALQGAMMPIMGLLMMGQGMGGGAPAMPPGSAPVPEVPEGMPNLPTAPEAP